MAKTRTPALGAEGWFTEDGESPALIGNKCTACGTVFFPAASYFCRNPECGGRDFEPTPLSRQGTVWSYTDAQYQPPPPYVAAVELADEGMVVMGQLATGYGVEDITVGTPVELIVETLFEDDDHEYTVWKWKPA
jgi:uncharacterized OB-fold protein